MKNTIAENLLKLQKRSGKSKKDFAITYGIKDSTFSSYISGRAVPSVDLLLSICEGEGVELDWLCGRVNGYATLSVAQVASIISKMLFGCAYDCENANINIKKANDGSIAEASIVFPGGCTTGNEKLLEMMKRVSDLQETSSNLKKEQFDLIMDSIINDYSMEFLH